MSTVLRGLLTSYRRSRAQRRHVQAVHARVAKSLTPPPPSAFARFGEGSAIGPFSRVAGAEYIAIGRGVVIHEHAWLSVVKAVEGITPSLRIGDGTSLGRMTTIACVCEVEIGPRVLTAERVFIGDTYHGYEDATRPVIDQPAARPAKVIIERGAFLGVGAIVLRGVTVGEGAYVGAGAVVTKDVPARSVAIGNPARVVRRYNSAKGAWERIDGGRAG